MLLSVSAHSHSSRLGLLATTNQTWTTHEAFITAPLACLTQQALIYLLLHRIQNAARRGPEAEKRYRGDRMKDDSTCGGSFIHHVIPRKSPTPQTHTIYG